MRPTRRSRRKPSSVMLPTTYPGSSTPQYTRRRGSPLPSVSTTLPSAVAGGAGEQAEQGVGQRALVARDGGHGGEAVGERVRRPGRTGGSADWRRAKSTRPRAAAVYHPPIRPSAHPPCIRRSAYPPCSSVSPCSWSRLARSNTTCGSSSCSTASTRSASVSGVSSGSDGDRPLRDDGSAIVLLVHVVHGGAGLRGAARQHRFVHAAAVHPRAAERGQQRRVDINQPPGKLRDHGSGDELQVPGQHDELGVRQCGEQLARHRRGRAVPRRGCPPGAPARGRRRRPCWR